MTEVILQNETYIRLAFFFSVLTVVGAWEVFSPRRKLSQNKWVRWYSNLGIVVLNTVLIRMIFSATAVSFAFIAQERGWGLFNNLSLPPILAVMISVVLLDLAIYFQHVIFHSVPTLWRLHQMHHADLDLDVTTGTRFHPVEIVISLAIKFLAVSLLGAPPIAVIIFEVLLNATAMFNHGNIYLPLNVDRFLRLWVVTPDMHRIHHSIYKNETNSNFGFNLPWWDRLFGTYRESPKDAHENMVIGLDQYREPKHLHFHRLLVLPFLKNKKF